MGSIAQNCENEKNLPVLVIGIVSVEVEHFCQVIVRHIGIERPADALLLGFTKHFTNLVTAAVNSAGNAPDRMVEALQPQDFPIINQDYRLQ